uniref:Uncharacterized protein n=1 Tax=Sphaerodactylus townsendi TaxID=933632 RepID=A0ACB8E4D8_9SAUR
MHAKKRSILIEVMLSGVNVALWTIWLTGCFNAEDPLRNEKSLLTPKRHYVCGYYNKAVLESTTVFKQSKRLLLGGQR